MTIKRRHDLPPIPPPQPWERPTPEEFEHKFAAVGLMIGIFGAVTLPFNWDSHIAWTSGVIGIPSAYYFWRSSRAR